MLDCLETDYRDVWWNWISNGWDRTLDALGIRNRFGGYNPQDLFEALGQNRIDWLRSLPIYHISEPYLFVHAGIVPGRPIKEQKKKDMLWIRTRFLESNVTHEYIVVHGHTQTETPELRHNRIGIDTGAARPKTLTAVVLNDLEKPRFINVTWSIYISNELHTRQNTASNSPLFRNSPHRHFDHLLGVRPRIAADRNQIVGDAV